MSYDREIEDSVLIQLIILYALQKAGKPVNQNQLSDLVLDNCTINIFNYNIAVAHLINIDHIKEFTAPDNSVMYDITEDGLQSIDFFISDIPIYIREPIERSIVPMFLTEEKKKSVTAELYPIDYEEYVADCAIYDCGKPLLKISFYSGTRELGKEVINNFKCQPDVIYKTLLHLLMKPDGGSDDE